MAADRNQTSGTSSRPMIIVMGEPYSGRNTFRNFLVKQGYDGAMIRIGHVRLVPRLGGIDVSVLSESKILILRRQAIAVWVDAMEELRYYRWRLGHRERDGMEFSALHDLGVSRPDTFPLDAPCPQRVRLCADQRVDNGGSQADLECAARIFARKVREGLYAASPIQRPRPVLGGAGFAALYEGNAVEETTRRIGQRRIAPGDPAPGYL